MKTVQKIQIGKDIIKAKILNQRRPFSVNWSLTNRCNLSCAYCSIPERSENELTTEQVLRLIDEMSKAGVIKLGLSGGEPLLRHDLDLIIDKAKENNIFISLTTNGILAKKWLKTLKKIDCVLLSMDGSQEVHNQTGKWNVNKLLDSIRMLKDNKVSVAISAVMTKPSLLNIDYLFKLSDEYKIRIAFQPFSYVKFLSLAKTKTCDIAPSKEETRAAVEKIMAAKENGLPILNSTLFLKMLMGQNKFDPQKCLAGERFCYLDTNGDVYPCSPMTERMNVFNAVEMGFAGAFNKMPRFSCGNGCSFACYIDYHYLFSLHWSFLNDIFKGYLRSKQA